LFGREDFCPVAVFEVLKTCAADLSKDWVFASFDCVLVRLLVFLKAFSFGDHHGTYFVFGKNGGKHVLFISPRLS
jgi:hypothetical protein